MQALRHLLTVILGGTLVVLSACVLDDEPMLSAGASMKGAPASDSCVKGRLKAVPALHAIQKPLLGKTYKEGAKTIRFDLNSYRTPRSVSGPGFRIKNATSTKDPAVAAVGTLMANRPLLGLGVDDKLVGVPGAYMNGTTTVVHLRQVHKGVPVYGARVTVDVDSNGDIVSLANSTIPDIIQASTASVSSAMAKTQLMAKHGSLKDVTSAMYYRGSGRHCDTADLAWRIEFRAGMTRREAWVHASKGTVLADSEKATHAFRGGVWTQSGTTCDLSPMWGAPYYHECTTCPYPCTGTGDAYNACVWIKQLWDYWANSSLHGSASRFGYDAGGGCMKFHLMHPSCSASAGDYDPCHAVPDYTTRGVIAHEFGHGLIAHACKDRNPSCSMDVRPGQELPVYEHIADMQAAAIDTIWKVEAKSHAIRDWQDPTTVTTTKGLPARFPVNFDDYNVHAWIGGNQPYYRSWHVPSTLWSHMIYNLSQSSTFGIGRAAATELVYRTLVNRMEVDDDFSFTGYGHHMRLEAATMGYQSQVEQAQVNAKLWMPAEMLLPNCYTRPGIVSGKLRIGSTTINTVRVYYNEWIPFTSDKLLVAWVGESHAWNVEDTGLSPSSVSGAISSAYDDIGHQYFIAWPNTSGSVDFARRSDLMTSPSWTTLQSISSVSTSDDVAIVAAAGQVRLYYRDATTGKLRYVKWQGTSWSSALSPPSGYDVAMTSAPAAKWDGSRVQLTYLTASGTLGVLQITPGTSADSWNDKDSFEECFFDDRAAEHKWHNVPAGVGVNSNLYILGPSSKIMAGKPEIQQALGYHTRGGTNWEFADHGGLEHIGDAVDAVYHSWDTKLWAVSYLGSPYSEAAVFWKVP
ncbi:hypothetical protein GF377_11210 [candidate division GN15 bacterium]|nr:hypothetical protein [candidate division GN15 bacterium]